MRKIFVGAALASLMSIGLVAQSGGCGDCYVNGFLDIPSPTQIVTVTPGQSLTMVGWFYFCNTGEGENRLDLWWYDDSGFAHQIPSQAIHVYAYDRPDVRQAFVQSCPNLWWHTDAGWYFTLDYGYIPVGTHILGINLWKEPYLYQPNGPWQPSFTRTVVIQ